MFHFHRSRTGSTEIFDIIIPQDSLPDAEARFGKPLQFDHRKQLFHEVGIVVFIHDTAQTEYVVACKSRFSEDECSTFYQQLEMLAGHRVHARGAEPDSGWFERDVLQD
jgi:hypothetical protein